MKWNDAYVQVALVGALAFCCPGMFNAMQGLGGAGNATSRAASIANASLYACFAVFGYFGGAFFNLMGNRPLIVLGGFTYCIYAAGMYACGVKDGLEWLAGLVGGILGLGAGWFWTAQGAMMMSYATPENKGRYIALFWIIFNLGGMVGGFINFGINYHETAGTANAGSYFTFVVIMAIGALGGLALVKPETVIREDKEPVVVHKAPSAMSEITGAISVTCHIPMILLTVPFLASNWYYTYQFSGYNLNIFNIRTRGFNSAFYWGAQMLSSWLLGYLLDTKKLSTRARGLCALGVISFEMILAWILGAIVQYTYKGGFERGIPLADGLVDFTGDGRFGFPFIVYMLYGFGDAMIQTYAYWLMASLAVHDPSLCARYAGYYKGIQSAGAAIAWGIDLSVDYKPQFIICFVLAVVSFPLMAWVNYFYIKNDDENEYIKHRQASMSMRAQSSGALAAGTEAPYLASEGSAIIEGKQAEPAAAIKGAAAAEVAVQ